MLAYNPEMDDAANAAAMQGAAASVRAGEVVTAVRDATVDGKAVRAGEVMGILEGDLVVSGPQRQEVLGALIEHAAPDEGSLITLYWGGDTTEAEADEAALHLQGRCPGVDVELVHGGQPYYHYLVSIE
jgi:dihydroxyacetone kinase-like predicted kinase